MIVSLAAVGWVLFKFCCLAGWAGFSAIWFMWPINDQPTSKTQVAVWAIGLLVCATLLFADFIQITA